MNKQPNLWFVPPIIMLTAGFTAMVAVNTGDPVFYGLAVALALLSIHCSIWLKP